ncbi:hypothetical protein [Kitasatospora purpeofusca]|uniref:hypothetical protein n=1 Tax=Kitasatospora purpeofusca TaxID=67352 RepID=UPI0036D28907
MPSTGAPTGEARPVTPRRSLIDEARRTARAEPEGNGDPHWTMAVTVALAHLVAASDGAAVALPDGPLADTFRRLLDDGPARHAALAVVPQHPQSGEPWPAPPGVTAVPLAVEVRAHLAFRPGRPLVPATGRLPDGVERDDVLPPRLRHRHLRPAHTLLHGTPATLPAIRHPWLRAIHDRGTGRTPAG